MSKLDEVIIKGIKAGDYDWYQGESADEEAKNDIKALFLELVGDDEDLYGDAYGIHEAQNDLRQELRDKINAL